MESKIVFKVSYGKVTRRFIAPIGEDEKIDLDIAKLREKIDRFFRFSPDSRIALSYLDEDGDKVALADEDDLDDLLNQSLNPVRINVESHYEVDNKFSDTPLRSPQSDLNSLSNVIKSIPEPFRESFSKISLELVSKAASTGQLISGLIDSISKLGQPLNAESSRNEIPSQKSEIEKTENTVDTKSTDSGTEGSTNVNEDAHEVSGPSGGNSELIVTKTNGTDLSESSTNVFHKSIRCDGCGVQPITGPCFKSKFRENYDLCRICFYTFGDDDDIRIDQPVASCPDLSFRGEAFPKQVPQHVFQLSKEDGPSLDSHFVLDINILDGTVLAPSTPFTKIWRMKNNGTLSWPKGTKLVWIGGDNFSYENCVEVLPIGNGLSVDEEINIAVDFCTPEVSGRYLSYWRLATPSGQKFGQRVWVIIEVDDALIDPINFGYNYLNLNLPPVDSETSVIDNNINTIHHPLVVDGNYCPVIRSRPFVIGNPETTASFPESRRFVIGNPETTASFPESSLAPSTPTDASLATTIEQTLDNNINFVEERLLMELEEMGFKKTNLNKEILRKNEYDLQQSIDDLCEVGEWDPILEELQETGFPDKEMNKRLLKKNKGNIQFVVLDLIYGENA